eukprot:7713367-Alexandrium_andersonii.AAC.1
MSASLVGSEMCIRDRGCSLARGTDNRKAMTLYYKLKGKAWDDAEELDAVSYTHLTLPTICSV